VSYVMMNKKHVKKVKFFQKTALKNTA